MLARQSVVTIYVRHQGSCRYASRQGRSFARDCDCVKWLRYSGDACFCQGKTHGSHRQHKLTTASRSWSVAEDKRAELQERLDSGESGKPLPAVPQVKRQTVEQSIETFITAKEGEGISAGTIRKLRYQLGTFKEFLANRSKFFPAEITKEDVIEYRAGWKSWKSGRTRQKAQQNLRGFLRFACRENLAELLDNLKAIKLSKADKERSKPQPFTEDQLKTLFAQVPKTFPDAEKAARVAALIRFMSSTGVAIRDTVQLERTQITDGLLEIERQKTAKPVKQTLDADLHKELLAVANSNPKYIFWNGTSKPTSATGLWQTDLRQLMGDAGLWIKGNLSHRFRDTAVDWWLGNGYSLTEIAAMLGDTVAIVEEHYKDWASKRMQERLAKLPRRSWAVAR
jgi:site-specific recombinase XerD